MKKIISIVILTTVVVGGLVFGFTQFDNDEIAFNKIKTENPKKAISKPLSVIEFNTVRKKWEASPDGVAFKNWEASPEGKKVLAAITKISKSARDFTDMEGVVTSLTLPPGSRLGFGIMVKIDDEEYILSFGIEQPGENVLNLKNEFDLLRNLKVNDKIIIRSHNISKAPKYSYPIVAGEYVEREGEIIYKRTPREGGC